MNDRHAQLLVEIAKEYVKTAEPVASRLLAEKYHQDLSSATIRNDMADLEEAGYIAQPHTSAGRILTEKGFRFLIDSLDYSLTPGARERENLTVGLDELGDRASKIKKFAKNTAQVTHHAAFVSFGTEASYYTGLTGLFSQPEFRDQEFVCSISEVVDQLDEVLLSLSGILKGPIEARVGADNPFGSACGMVVTRLGGQVVFGVLGPLRMDYQANVARLNYARQLLP